MEDKSIKSKNLGLKGEIKMCSLATHELGAVTAALTAVLHLQCQTEFIGGDKEGYITVQKEINWKTLT